MIVYAYVQKGLHHEDSVCQDTILLNHIVASSGTVQLNLPDKFLLGVADGVGGENAGEVASAITMTALSQCGGQDAGIEKVKQMLYSASEKIAEIAHRTEICRGMASTFVGLYCGEGEAYVLWAGNSRLYQVTEGSSRNVQQLTVDHNEKNEWLESGRIDSLEQARGGEALTAYVGMSGTALKRRLETEQVYLPGTKRFFLTSDGIHDHISEQTLKELLLSKKPGEELLPELAGTAIENGSTDDMSVVMLEWEEDK